MEVIINNINPSGFGKVTGGGTKSSGDDVSILATPSESYPFLHFVVDGTTIVTANPYEFIAGTEDVNLVAYFDYSLITWLDSQIKVELDRITYIGVLENRKVAIDIQKVDATEKEVDLCYADCLKAILADYNETIEKMQGWSSAKKMTYKDEISNLMNFYYDKWGESIIEDGFMKTVSNLW